MYFSENRTLRKALSVTCVLCLASTLFAGCMKKDDVPPTTTDPGFGLNLNDTTAAPSVTQPSTTPTTAPVINENTGVVLTQISIRSSPSMDSTSIGQLFAGDRVELVRKEEVVGRMWGLIEEPNYGWIALEYVQMDMDSPGNTGDDNSTPAGNGDVTAPTAPTTGGNTNTTEIKGTITANALRIRSEPNTETSKVQGSYSKGDSVTILEVKNGWGRTNKGWIKMDYVDTTGNAGGTGNTGNTGNTNNTNGNGSTTVVLRGIVVAKELNIRPSASTEGDRIGQYTYGNRVEILEKSGTWGRTNKGWISLNYVYQDGTTGTNTASGTITATQLRVRSGPGTGYDVVGSYNQGDSVKVLEQFTYDGVTWGCTNKGWISMAYVDTGSGSNNGGSDSGSSTSRTGTITGNGVNIRSGAGTDYNSVGSLNSGDRVTILETTMSGGMVWGRISQGWVAMTYVDLDE